MLKNSTLFHNCTIDKKELRKLLSSAFIRFGKLPTSFLATKLKDLGFHYATKAGVSISIDDLRVPPTKVLLMKTALKEVDIAQKKANKGKINEVERYLKVLNIWSNTSESLKESAVAFFKTKDPLNSVYMMAFSGARGNVSQVRQLVGMRGLMADPSGQIIDIPITANFREGLTISDYIISSYGARKGLVDTALRTADSGYLTRRLVDVAQDVITRESDCKTQKGISIKNKKSNRSFFTKEKLIGRVLAASTLSEIASQKLTWSFLNTRDEITQEVADYLLESKFSQVMVRSPLTCDLTRAVCRKCYGWDLSLGSLVDLGVAVGIIAGQSIGEPGTQLTMRTFHTGGVFTSEPSRQIRAKYSGKILFPANLKTKKARSDFGDKVLISQNLGNLELRDYRNDKRSIEVPPESMIFVKNNSFVKKNESLFELSPVSIKTKVDRILKDVYAERSGQIKIENADLLSKNFSNLKNKVFFSKNFYSYKQLKRLKFLKGLIWILSGQVYILPRQSLLQIKPGSWIQANQSLAQSTLITKVGGNAKFFYSSFLSQIENIEISKHSTCLENLPLKIEIKKEKLERMAMYGSKNHVIYLDTEISSSPKIESWVEIGEIKDNKYTTKTGGHFICAKRQIQLKTIITVFYVPEFFFPLNCAFSEIKIKTGKYLKKDTEFLSKNFLPFSGVVQVEVKNKIAETLSLKPGQKVPVPKSYDETDLFKETYHEQVFYPGEKLFEKFEIKHCSYLEVKRFGKELFLLVTPIVRYEICKKNLGLTFFPTNIFQQETIKLDNAEITFTPGEQIKTYQPIQWLTHSVLLNLGHSGKNIFITNETKKTNTYFSFSFCIKEKFLLKDYVPVEIKKEDFKLTVLVEEEQYVEPYTIIGCFQFLASANTIVYSIKQQFSATQKRIFLTTNHDYRSIYVEEKNTNFSINQFLSSNERLSSNISITDSGFVEKTKGNNIFLRLAQPYLFSSGGQVRVHDGYFIKKEEILGQLFYTKAKTEDIVQGLPKVEELLEGRKATFDSVLARRPGMISKIMSSPSKMLIWVSSGRINYLFSKTTPLKMTQLIQTGESELYAVKRPCRLIVRLGQFVNVGQPLENKGSNPNSLLDIYFQYYQNLSCLSILEAYKRSINIIQSIILNSVQNVYSSQGVTISDKHLEIIVKQMTTKVEIISPGNTNLLPKELIDAWQINFINSCLLSVDKAVYRPILLGITRAALKTDSFLSTASFQQTTQVLTEAAVEGKTDWLRGLKENVITGSLIPVGTGFYSYVDISYLLATVPRYNTKKKDLLKRQKNLKKRLNFKLSSGKVEAKN